MSLAKTWFSTCLMLSLAACSTSEAERIDSCGQIYRDRDCLLFFAYGGPHPGCSYVLPDTAQLAVDSEWRIVGDARRMSRRCGYITYYNALDPVSIGPCVPETLGCGVLWNFEPEYNCYVWSKLGYVETRLLTDGLHGFDFGDTVFAVGIRMPCIDICICGCGCLVHYEFSACGDTLTPVERMSWGRVKALYRE
ncbi:MAG: hypothetical protein FJY88_02950 [Candidatus Eisenbacteria bacterium]|nr:hypothetical protein [Candidatus Eisenbacteria bacterium]